mgnify:CR=1 FL=1
MGLKELPNWLEIKLNARNWVLKLKVVEDFRMEDTDSSNLLSGKNDICTSLREELWVFIVSMRLQMEILVQSSADLGHHLAQTSVNHFERSLSVQLHNANLSEVDATSVSCHVDLCAVRNLEDLLRNLLVLV